MRRWVGPNSARERDVEVLAFYVRLIATFEEFDVANGIYPQ
jgi:hypothetical protein